MEVRRNAIVPLGYGKYFRADKIIGLEPIEEERGPGRRTRVYIEGVSNPLVASRTENSILSSLIEVPKEIIEATVALELLQDLLNDFKQVGPMLRKSIKKEAKLDIDSIERRIEEILNHEIDFDEKQ